MSKISKEQLQKINDKCENNWNLDMQYLIFHREKQLFKTLQLSTEEYLQFTLGYDWQNQIIFRISKYSHKQGDYFAISKGLGKKRILSEAQKRKSINALIEFTKSLTNDECLRINAETEVTKSSIFVASEEF